MYPSHRRAVSVKAVSWDELLIDRCRMFPNMFPRSVLEPTMPAYLKFISTYFVQ